MTHLAFLLAGFLDSSFSAEASAALLSPVSASAAFSSFLLAGFPLDLGFSSFLPAGVSSFLLAGFSCFLLAGFPVDFGFSSFLLAGLPEDLGLEAVVDFLLAGLPPFRVLSGSCPYTVSATMTLSHKPAPP